MAITSLCGLVVAGSSLPGGALINFEWDQMQMDRFLSRIRIDPFVARIARWAVTFFGGCGVGYVAGLAIGCQMAFPLVVVFNIELIGSALLFFSLCVINMIFMKVIVENIPFDRAAGQVFVALGNWILTIDQNRA